MLSRAVNNPGRFVLGPTQTTGSFPYGGISLGLHRDAEIDWRTDQITDKDPLSGQPVAITRKGADYPEIFAILEGPNWDEDYIAAAFQRVTRTSSLPFSDPPETRLEGTSIPFSVIAWPPVLFVSDDPTLKSVYIERPLPTLSLRQGVALHQAMHAGLPIRIIPSPTASGKGWQVARLENMVL